MLYTIEIFPNGKERIGPSSFFIKTDFSSWSSLIKEELSFFYRQDPRVDMEKSISTILTKVKIDVPAYYRFKIFGATIICLVTEQLSALEFQSFAERHSKDVLLRLDWNLLDDYSFFFNWLVHGEFKQKSYYRLLESFKQSNYTFFEKKSRKVLKVLIDELIDDMEVLLERGKVRDENWFLQMEEAQKKYREKTGLIEWIVPCEQEAFENHKIHLRKKHSLSLIQMLNPKDIQNVDYGGKRNDEFSFV